VANPGGAVCVFTDEVDEIVKSLHDVYQIVNEDFIKFRGDGIESVQSASAPRFFIEGRGGGGFLLFYVMQQT
jgi:hypothetical protein